MNEPFINIFLNILFGTLFGSAVSLTIIYLLSLKKRKVSSNIRVRFLKVIIGEYGLIGIVPVFMVLTEFKFSWIFFTVGGIFAGLLANSIYFLATKKIIRTRKERYVDIPYKE